MINTNSADCFPALYFVIPGDINNLTGGYGYDRELIKELVALGYAIRVLKLSGEFPNPGANALAEAAQIFSQLPAGAVVIVDGLAFGVMDEIAQRESQRLTIIALCHHPLTLETGLDSSRSIELKKSETRALTAARAIIVTSATTGNILKQDFAVSHEKITLACPGTRRQNFAPCINQTPLLLTVATLTKRKGHDVLINALAQISHLPWQARFVGGMDFDPQWSAYLQQLVHEKKLHHRIAFAGKVQDVHEEYMKADLFVLPSYFEGYGMAFAEALAYGLPIVAAKAGAVPDVVPLSAGILIPPGNVNELKNAIEGLLLNCKDRRRLQAGAQQAAQHLPTWKDCAQSIAKLIFNMRKS